MKTLLRALLALGVALTAPTLTLPAGEPPSFDELWAQASTAEERGDVQKALDGYMAAEKLQPQNARVLQKIAKQLSDSVSDQRDNASRREMAERALAYSQRAEALAPDDPACVLSIAICHGKLAQLDAPGARVEHAKKVQLYAEKALSLNPNYDWAHHVLGRWHYELLQVGGPSRALARMFYGGLPRTTAEESIRHLKRATELSPETAAHWLELGFSYLAAGDRKAALESFRKGMEVPPRERQDFLSRDRAKPMLDPLEKQFKVQER